MTKAKDTRIIIMSNDLMRLYEIQTPLTSDGEPLTFYDPQECLEMMTEMDEEELQSKPKEPAPSKAVRMARQWGELELRLSFFPSTSKWQ